MKGTVLYGPRDIRYEERDEPRILKSTDAIIRLSATCVCGSDLWPYRGIQKVEGPMLMGHEYCGTVEEVGSEVKSVKPGQFVIACRMLKVHQRVSSNLDWKQEGRRHGNQASRFAILGEGPLGLVHRDSPHRSTIPGAPAHVQGASVTFEPGARTAWHIHPLGQTLLVTAGLGWAQREGGPIEEIRPGDVVWLAPGEKHWHGASPSTAMTHTAIQESLNGKVVDWMEHVTDQQYSDEHLR